MLVVHYGPVVCYGIPMNIKPAPAKTARAALIKGLRNAALFFTPFAVIMVVMWTLFPTTHNVVPPESGAAAQTVEHGDYDRAMAKCDTLPAGTLPGAAVIATADGVAYTTNPARVDLAFNIALGEKADPSISGVTLCK